MRSCLPLFLILVLADLVAAQLPDGFSSQRVGFGPFGDARPVGFALLPDGRVLMVERSTGNVRLNAVAMPTSAIIHTVPDVNSVGGEQGLLGVGVDPDWPTRPFLYFHYTHTSGNVYITMFEAQGDLMDPTSTNITLTNPYHLLTDLPDSHELHQAGTVRFGPDGMLYVSLGDDGNACNAQDLAILAGKILRLDVSAAPGEGTGPPAKSTLVPVGNPFPGPGDNERLVWAWGLRNPFRFTIDPLNGDLFLGDVGLITYEEMDQIPYAGGGGENFGWPQREGPIDPKLGHKCGIGNEFTEPIYFYPRGEGVTVIAGPRYRTPTSGPSDYWFPAQYEGSLFLVDFFSGWWRRLEEGPGGWGLAPPVPGQPSATNWAEGLAFCSDIQQGPDGAIYYIRLVPPELLQGVFRIVYTPAVDGPETGVGPRVLVAPNPAGGGQSTRFTWTAPRPGESRLRIYDVAGRLVRSIRAPSSGGSNSLSWAGADADGRPVPAGVYLYVLEMPAGERRSGKVSRLR